MWNTIANFKENLSQMASEVLETVEELEDPRDDNGGDSSPGSARSLQEGRGFHRRRRSTESLQSFDHHRSWRTRGSKESNGVAHLDNYESRFQEMQKKCQDLADREKELLDQVHVKEHAFRELDDSHRNALQEVEKLKLELERMRLNLENSQQSEHGYQIENRDVCTEDSRELENLRKEVQQRDETIYQLQASISNLENELNAGKEQLTKALDLRVLELQDAEKNTVEADDVHIELLKARAQEADVLSVKLQTAESEMTDLKKMLETVTLEKDKAISNLSRLRQHLLEKENADSEKMDRDSEQITVLETKFAATCARVVQLEQALSQALTSQADTSKKLNEELQASNVEIESLNSKLNNAYAVLEARNNEIANLQVALGQYYAESDAKERVQKELNVSKEQVKALSERLEAANNVIDTQSAQMKDVINKLQAEEQKSLDSQQKSRKLQEDIIRLRRALEESMVRLNRMSSDSDYSVDRRIVIKLLVTYFEKGHNREVLDLMARILGFSEDDKRRVGLSHQRAGKPGVVKSVLGLPGRVVGGLLSGNSEASLTTNSNQSFADLWIDFLLKESEEREKAMASFQNSEVNMSSPSITPRNDLHSLNFNTEFTYDDSDSTASDTGTRGHRRAYSRT